MSQPPVRTEVRYSDDVDDADIADGRPLVWDATAGTHVYADLAGGGIDRVTIATENKSGLTLPAGTPAAVHSTGVGAIRASAAGADAPAFGLYAEAVGDAVAAPVRLSGTLTLDDWTDVAGTAELAPRATYYLSATPGRITDSPPGTLGQVVQEVGVAVAPDTLDVRPRYPILL